MFLASLDRKPFFNKKDGNIVRDLTQSMFDFRANNYTSFNAFKIPKDYVMRPDLISQAVYNNTLYAEYILKYNGISNPFSLNEGDVVLIPNLESAKLNTKTTAGSGSDADPSKKLRDSFKYIDPSKIPKRDKDLANFDDRKFDETVDGGDGGGQGGGLGGRTIRYGVLPPNIAEEGTTQIVERNGRIYFGEGIGESACLKSGMSSSEFLTKVIKSKKI
jgi:hypothetical protein